MLPICLQSELLFDPLAILLLIHSSYKSFNTLIETVFELLQYKIYYLIERVPYTCKFLDAAQQNDRATGKG